MTLENLYPKEWDEITNKKIPKKEINTYFLKFVAKLIREEKINKKTDTSVGDGWSMVINMDKHYYKLTSEIYGFLFRLGDYGMQEHLGHGTSEYGDMLYTLQEVEPELIKITGKFGLNLDL